MPFISPGTPTTVRVVFNSGTLDFGTNRIVEIDNVSLSLDYTVEALYVLGSIKPQDLVRHTQKTTLTGKMKSFPPEMLALALGASTPGTPNEIDTLDGQPTFVNPVLTFFDRNNKEIQYQLKNALFKSNKLNAKMEEFAEFDFEIEASDLLALDYTS